MKNRQVMVMMVILLFLTVSLSGCSPETPEKPLPMPANAVIPPTPMPERMTMDIYWDATISMQGFTKLAAGNIYRNLPDTLGDLGESLGEVHFFRFGEQVTPVEGREYRNFTYPEIYTESVTSFSRVLEESHAEHLTVVVTDLFESNADWSNISKKLKEKYFSQHLTVAIIGVKNSFSGDIFDVGLNAAAFNYDSGDDPARFRPFYLFLMGSETQVRTFLERWEEKQSSNNEMEYVVFSEYFTSGVMNFSLTAAKDKQNLFEDERLPKADDRLQEAGFANHSDSVKITLPGRCQLAHYVCLKEEKLSDLEIRTTIYALNAEEKWEQPENGQEVEVSFKTYENVDEQGNNCELKLMFPPDGVMPRGKIGLMQVQILPSRQQLNLPSWITAWDMGNIDTQPDSFDGTKTVNLERIAVSLKDSLLSTKRPVFAEFYLLVDGR